MAARLQPRSRGGRFRNINLGEETVRIRRAKRYSAPFGIIGRTGTGRKTLAARFADMEANVLSIENAKTFFNSFFLRTRQPVVLHLRAFICPPAESGGRSISTFEIPEREDFCCFVFIFDVADRESFTSAKGFMNLHESVTPNNFLVGNKCDLKMSVPQRRLVPREDVDQEVDRRNSIKYFECSARTKENVRPLLDAIQECALKEKYKFEL